MLQLIRQQLTPPVQAVQSFSPLGPVKRNVISVLGKTLSVVPVLVRTRHRTPN